MQRFTDIRVWQRAHALVLEVYRATTSFPKEERYGLTSQLRRAALSVPTNVAEGAKRDSNGDYARFLNIAEASLAEAQYLLLLSRDLGYLEACVADAMIVESQQIARMLSKLRDKVSETFNLQPSTFNQP
jgi:four helix bundle protein